MGDYPLISEHGLIGDLQTSALVATDGAIDWFCVPRFDSPSVFASLLGTDDDGTWRVAPSGAETCSSRHYQPDTLILETDWETVGGRVRVTDFMPRRSAAPD